MSSDPGKRESKNGLWPTVRKTPRLRARTQSGTKSKYPSLSISPYTVQTEWYDSLQWFISGENTILWQPPLYSLEDNCTCTYWALQGWTKITFPDSVNMRQNDCFLCTKCRQENTFVSPNIPTTWEGYFSPALYLPSPLSALGSSHKKSTKGYEPDRAGFLS